MHRHDVRTLNKALAAYKKLSLNARTFRSRTFVAVGGKVLAETPDTKLDFA